MHDLALKVTFVDYVEINESHRAYTGGSKVEPERRSESAGADASHRCVAQLFLSLDPHLGKQKAAAVPSNPIL
jgi:hypothetical protein